MKPQLADSIDPTKIEKYLTNDAWVIQQKLDGHRVLIRVRNGHAMALGRDGEPKANAIPSKILDQFKGMTAGEWFFDGELVGVTLWLFDLPHVTGHVALTDPYQVRHHVLTAFFAGWQPDPCIRLLATAVTTAEKRELHERTVAAGAEGVMLKEINAPYRPGRRSVHTLKAKYVKTADVVIKRLGVGGKENCEFFVYDPTYGQPGAEVMIGKCSLIGKPNVAVGDVIEVKFLYTTTDHRLFQPRMMRVRDDKSPSECTIDQLTTTYTSRDVLD